jgi:hypothetical protein
MARPALAVVAVLLVAVTAGCGGVLEPTDGSRDTYGVPPETPTTTGTPGTGETVSVALSGIEPQLRSQERRLRAVGNYTLRQVRNETGAESRVSLLRRTERVDATAGRILVRNRYDLSRGYERARQTFYQDGTRVWNRLSRNGTDPEFRNRTTETPGSAVGSSIDTLAELGRSLVEVPLEPSGSTRFDGEWMVRYTASDPESAVLSTKSAKHHSLTVLVDDRGIVRYVAETVVRDDAGRQKRTVRIEVVDVGTTTVERPDWVHTGEEGDREDSEG